MAFEIERKFLVRGDDWRRFASSQATIRQGYLTSGERSSTRVRITEGRYAVTIKSKRAELRRLEVEYAISVADADALLSLRQSGLIEKVRYQVPWQGSTWEIDVFSGENVGLVIAEIELAHVHDYFERPPWLGLKLPGSRNTTMGPKPGVLICSGGSRPSKLLRANVTRFALTPAPLHKGLLRTEGPLLAPSGTPLRSYQARKAPVPHRMLIVSCCSLLRLSRKRDKSKRRAYLNRRLRALRSRSGSEDFVKPIVNARKGQA